MDTQNVSTKAESEVAGQPVCLGVTGGKVGDGEVDDHGLPTKEGHTHDSSAPGSNASADQDTPNTAGVVTCGDGSGQKADVGEPIKASTTGGGVGADGARLRGKEDGKGGGKDGKEAAKAPDAPKTLDTDATIQAGVVKATKGAVDSWEDMVDDSQEHTNIVLPEKHSVLRHDPEEPTAHTAPSSAKQSHSSHEMAGSCGHDEDDDTWDAPPVKSVSQKMMAKIQEEQGGQEKHEQGDAEQSSWEVVQSRKRRGRGSKNAPIQDTDSHPVPPPPPPTHHPDTHTHTITQDQGGGTGLVEALAALLAKTESEEDARQQHRGKHHGVSSGGGGGVGASLGGRKQLGGAAPPPPLLKSGMRLAPGGRGAKTPKNQVNGVDPHDDHQITPTRKNQLVKRGATEGFFNVKLSTVPHTDSQSTEGGPSDWSVSLSSNQGTIAVHEGEALIQTQCFDILRTGDGSKTTEKQHDTGGAQVTAGGEADDGWEGEPEGLGTTAHTQSEEKPAKTPSKSLSSVLLKGHTQGRQDTTTQEEEDKARHPDWRVSKGPDRWDNQSNSPSGRDGARRTAAGGAASTGAGGGTARSRADMDDNWRRKDSRDDNEVEAAPWRRPGGMGSGIMRESRRDDRDRSLHRDSFQAYTNTHTNDQHDSIDIDRQEADLLMDRDTRTTRERQREKEGSFRDPTARPIGRSRTVVSGGGKPLVAVRGMRDDGGREAPRDEGDRDINWHGGVTMSGREHLSVSSPLGREGGVGMGMGMGMRRSSRDRDRSWADVVAGRAEEGETDEHDYIFPHDNGGDRRAFPHEYGDRGHRRHGPYAEQDQHDGEEEGTGGGSGGSGDMQTIDEEESKGFWGWLMDSEWGGGDWPTGSHVMTALIMALLLRIVWVIYRVVMKHLAAHQAATHPVDTPAPGAAVGGPAGGGGLSMAMAVGEVASSPSAVEVSPEGLFFCPAWDTGSTSPAFF
ncbi:unnamed protein product [Vitrella brassicaformis CCMP3155]|uniref:Uncharacterized protein n=2 Tax=Vitrella brassicaformis TaxID=1169539 RepID=A0A0G4EWX9_VITBC|nr:unnamed protein product [Vitrella brassicaformis CCMP3155]|eukprot:CEM03283.1 unnamed protein product [Vitrella brassicaformis CCMP3155]